jgi:hypothetical protein
VNHTVIINIGTVIMSDLTKSNGGGTPATQPDIDPYLAFSDSSIGFSGSYLSFSHGEWLYGQDKKILPLGTKLVAHMPGMKFGWRRWRDGRVADDLTQLITERHPLHIEPRNALGDNDSALWELMSGKPRDPWQKTMSVELIDGNEEKYLCSQSSKSGLDAMTALSIAYGKERRMRPGQLPLVELGAGFYMHPDKNIGKVHTPVLKLVGWVDGDSLEPVEDVISTGGGGEIPFDISAGAAPSAAASGPPIKDLGGQPIKPEVEAKKPRAPRF